MCPKTNKNKLYAAVVGYGNRGQIYADYSLVMPKEFGVCAIIDTNEAKLFEAKKRYGLPDSALFKSFADFLNSGIKCDFVINATMDQLHYSSALEILNAGFDMLIEKPIVSNAKQLIEIKDIADKKGLKVFVCHVLRYTPYFLKIKQIISSGGIGKVMTIEMNEHVGTSHYLTSYVRGKWNSEANCGSGFLLAKSCHDMDLVCWLNNSTEPESIASFGSRSQFIERNRPIDAAEFCLDCAIERQCPYSSVKHYLEEDVLPFLTWDRLNKPLDTITNEEKIEFLRSDIYGKCAYIAGGDIVDRQNIILNFKDGSTCTFNLVGGAAIAGRHIHIVGTLGEIEGRLEDDYFKLVTYNAEKRQYISEIISVEKEIVNTVKFGGHSGGDYAIVRDLVSYLNGDRSSLSITTLDDSVNGHICVYAAEKSRRDGKIVKIADIKK